MFSVMTAMTSLEFGNFITGNKVYKGDETHAL